MVEVNFYASLRQIVGSKSDRFPLSGSQTLHQLLTEIVDRYPALERDLFDIDGRIHGHIRIFINREDASYREQLAATIIEEKDRIDIFPAIGGGEI